MGFARIGYVHNKDYVLYVNIDSGQRVEYSHLPDDVVKDAYYFVHRSLLTIKPDSAIFEKPHTVVDNFDRDDLANPEQWIMASECLILCSGNVPANRTVESVKFADLFQTSCVKEAVLVIKTLISNRVRVPAAKFPSLVYVNEKHVICQTTDLYRTFARIVSRGRYVREAPHLLKRWLLWKRGNRKIPFVPYFVSALYDLGLPENDGVIVVDETTIVMTVKGLDWVNERAPNAFDTIVNVTRNTAVLRLGRWNVVPAVIVADEERELKHSSFDAPIKFVQDFVRKAVVGGEWVAAEETRTLAAQKDIKAEDFYRRLFRLVWANKRFIYNDTEVDCCTGQIIDSRPHYLKLYDYVAKDTGCITLPETDPVTGNIRYVNVPWATCCVYNPSRHVVEEGALYQLTEFLKNQCRTAPDNPQQK